MVRNGQKWLEIVRNCQKCLEMVRNGQKWLEMIRNGQKWLEMVTDRLFASNKLKNAPIRPNVFVPTHRTIGKFLAGGN